MCIRIIFSILLSFSLLNTIYAQEEENLNSLKKHKLLLSISHAYLPTGVDYEGNNTLIILPSWGLDYDFSLDRNWSLGLHTDMVVENFEYEENEIIQKRSRPITTTLILSRKLSERFTIQGGGGTEWAKEGSMTVIRLGLDYGLELTNNWEVAASLMADYNVNAYFTFDLGLGIGKSF